MPTNPSDARPVILIVEDEPLVRLFNADVLDEAPSLPSPKDQTRKSGKEIELFPAKAQRDAL